MFIRTCALQSLFAEFAKQVLSLARNGNPALMASFEASFEGTAFNLQTFDVEFFLDNARDIVEESNDVKR